MKNLLSSAFLFGSLLCTSLVCLVRADNPTPGLLIFDPTQPRGNGHDNGPHFSLPMRSMVISGSIVDAIAEVTLLQEFETTSTGLSDTATAVYQLPLYEQAAVTQFEARIGTRVITGQVFEKEDARQQFQDAVDAGQSAFLGEQVTADVFSITVGNLPPSQIVRITVVYLTTLETTFVGTAPGVRFRLPTGIAPRYTPASGTSLPGGENFLYEGLMIEINARMSLPLTQVTSSTHDISAAGDLTAGRATVQVTTTDPNISVLDRDLVVTFELEESDEPQIYVEQSDTYNTMALMLSIVPDLPTIEMGSFPQEYIFVVDRSGSMSDKVGQVRLALSAVLEILPLGTMFNFVGYGTSYNPLFSSSQLIDTHLTEGLSYASNLQADMGGTEVLPALQFVLTSLPPNSDYQRRIFLFTDGQVSNTQEVINYVSANLGEARIYTLGIGAHASTELVNGVARAGLGSAEFVDGTSAQAVQLAIQSQLNVALLPALTDIQLDWGLISDPGDSQQSPYVFPLLATGKRFIMYFVTSVRTPPLSISLSASISGTHQRVEYTVVQSSMVFLNDDSNLGGTDPITSSSLIHKMAGRSLIRDLEEGRSKFHAEERSYQEIRDEIVRLGILYQLPSSETSFLAIDDGESVVSPEVAFETDDAGRAFANGGTSHGRNFYEMFVSFMLPILGVLLWLWM